MKVLVLKDFRYAADGLKSKTMVAGMESEIRDELVEGLEKEGFIVVGLPNTTVTSADDYSKLLKKDLEEKAAARGIDVAGAKKDDLVALLQRADAVDALVEASNLSDLSDAELAKVATDRKIEVIEGASRDDIIALLMPTTSSS